MWQTRQAGGNPSLGSGWNTYDGHNSPTAKVTAVSRADKSPSPRQSIRKNRTIRFVSERNSPAMAGNQLRRTGALSPPFPLLLATWSHWPGLAAIGPLEPVSRFRSADLALSGSAHSPRETVAGLSPRERTATVPMRLVKRPRTLPPDWLSGRGPSHPTGEIAGDPPTRWDRGGGWKGQTRDGRADCLGLSRCPLPGSPHRRHTATGLPP
jgi:hypothetical protein